MKKIYITLTVLAAAVLVSCVREKSFENLTPLGENDIAFAMKSVTTKSAEYSSVAENGVTIPVGKTPKGEPIYLEETIEALNPNPGTKGAPAYTVNVGQIYSTMGVYANAGGFGDDTFEVLDQYAQHSSAPNPPFEGDGWRYVHKYDNSPWPSDGSAVDFYLRMPASPSGVTNLAYSGGATSFSYESPATAAAQQDIIFGQTTLTKQQHDSYLPNGAPVMMYHALTGVKFRNGWENGNQTKTIITKVEFEKLNNKGKCSVSSDGVVSWTDLEMTSTTVPAEGDGEPTVEYAKFSQEFNNPDYTPSLGADNQDGTFNYTTGNSNFGPSWYTGDNVTDHNLNNEEGEWTFWFIPQEITDNLILRVTFCIKTPDTSDGATFTHTIQFGKELNKGKSQNVKWDAGQLRTYTIKPFDVDVEIVDKMEDANTKNSVHVANTGNVDEYVRILIMGNWYGWAPGTTPEEMNSTEPSILVGYKYKGDEPGLTADQINQMVDPWFRGGYDGVDPYGHFDDSFTLGSLLGDPSDSSDDRDGNPDDWADASGGYYYTSKIGPGEGLNTTSATTDLFKSYTVTHVPDIYLPYGNTREKAVGVHLVMEIVIQAINVPKTDDGKDIWWLQAWYEATGVAKLNPADERRNKKYVARLAVYNNDNHYSDNYVNTISIPYVVPSGN